MGRLRSVDSPVDPLVLRAKKEEYGEATKYGLSLGIPDYQLDFSDDIKV